MTQLTDLEGDQSGVHVLLHPNRSTVSRVLAVLLHGWIFPIGQSGEASRWRIFYPRGLPRLVFKNNGDYRVFENVKTKTRRRRKINFPIPFCVTSPSECRMPAKLTFMVIDMKSLCKHMIGDRH